MTRKDRNILLHLLRSPYGRSDDVVREARQKAADELERLWALESCVREVATDLTQRLPPDPPEQNAVQAAFGGLVQTPQC